MFKVDFKEVKIIDIFDFKRGNSNYTKEYCKNKKGDYPLYSANNNEPHEYVDFYDFDGKYLTISVNGIAGIITIKDEKFSCTADRVVFIPKCEGICLEYMRYVLEPMFRSKIKGRIGINNKNEFSKLPLATIKAFLVSVPIKSDETFDLEAQIKIAKKYELVEKKKKELKLQKDVLEKINIDFFTDKPTKSVKISEICDVISENHKYTKTFINSHLGEYPVYSATLGEPFGFTSDYDFEEEALIVVNYGNSGMTYIVDGKYCIGRNVCGLRINKEYKNSISLDYIQVVQTSLFVNLAKGQKQKNLNQEMVRNAIITIPVKPDGTFDLEAQKEIATKYKKIEIIKNSLINELKKLISQDITLE